MLVFLHSNVDLVKEYEKAIADFNKAIELNPGYEEAKHNLAIAQRKKAREE